MQKFLIFLCLYLWSVFKRIGYIVFVPIYILLFVISSIIEEILSVVIDPIINLFSFIFTGETYEEPTSKMLEKFEFICEEFGDWLKS